MTWPSLLVFDLDGTLIDSAPDIRDAVNQMLAEYGRSPLALVEIRKMIGNGTHRLIERALAARPGPTVAFDTAHQRFIECYQSAPISLDQAYPGVLTTLPRLVAAGMRLTLCTNKPEAISRDILAALGLADCFERIVGGDSTPWRKPDPQGLLQICGELGVLPQDTVMIGDSEVDAETAAAGSIAFILMSYGYRRGPLEAIVRVAILDSVEELTSERLSQLAPKR